MHVAPRRKPYAPYVDTRVFVRALPTGAALGAAVLHPCERVPVAHKGAIVTSDMLAALRTIGADEVMLLTGEWFRFA